MCFVNLPDLELGSIGHIRTLQPFKTVQEIQAAYGPKRHSQDDAKPKTKRLACPIDPWTPTILQMWRDCAPIESISALTGKSHTEIRKTLSRYRVKRPAWYRLMVLRKASQARWNQARQAAGAA